MMLIHVMLFFSLCFLLGVYAFSGKSDLHQLYVEMQDTSDYVKSEYLMAQKYNHVTIMQGLDRVIDKAGHVQNDAAHGQALDDAYLENITKELRLTGLAVLTKDGKLVTHYQESGQLSREFLSHLQNSVILEVGDYPVRVYSDRMYKEDGSFVDFAAGGLPDGRVIVAYYRTGAVYAEGYDLDLQRLMSGFHTHLNSHVIVAKGNQILACNDKDIDEAEAKYGRVLEAIKVAYTGRVAKDEPVPILVDGIGYYASVTNGRNYYIYQFVSDDKVFANRTRNTFYAGFACLIFMLAILWSRQKANRKAWAKEQEREAEYQANLYEKAKEAEMANLAKTEFLRRMSHDIRTPINGIRGMVEIAGHYKDDVAKQEEYRKKVWEASGYLLELVNEVLEISKLESGKIVLENKPFNLKDMLRDIEEIVEKQADSLHISLTIENKCSHDRFIGSPLYVKRTLMNIIGNALKYNREGGFVTVKAREETISDTESRVIITCMDNGIGMSEDFQKRMFEPFAQEISDARSSYNGTGLGLAIAKRVVEQMGGTIDCQSAYGEGSVFTVTLPLTLDPNARDIETVKSTADISGVKILVAEDNELNMEIAEFLLEQAGATVVKAMNGQEAVDTFAASKEGEYDAILMDVMMPIMDGLTATRTIRAMERADAKTIPIIAMTANAFAEDRQNAMEAGMNEHLAKPLDSSLVIATLAAFLKK